MLSLKLSFKNDFFYTVISLEYSPAISIDQLIKNCFLPSICILISDVFAISLHLIVLHLEFLSLYCCRRIEPMWNILMCLRHWASAIRFSLSIGAFQCTMHSTLQFTYTCIQCNEINFDRLLFFFHFERVCKFLNMRINSRLASSCCLCFFHLHAVICSHWHPLP